RAREPPGMSPGTSQLTSLRVPDPEGGLPWGLAAGGCRENVPASTIPPETRRRLRHVPVCPASSLRVVKYGFAGRDAVKIDCGGVSVRPNPDESGAYLFVLRPRTQPLTIAITYNDGTVCRSTYPARIRPSRLPTRCGP